MQFGLSCGYNRIGVKTKDLLSAMGRQLPAGASIEQTFKIVELTPVLRFTLVPPDHKFAPFLQSGLGVYSLTATTETSFMGRNISNSTSDQYFGINLSGGFRAQLNERAGLLIAPSYHIIFSDEDGETESSKYFAVRGGLSFAL